MHRGSGSDLDNTHLKIFANGVVTGAFSQALNNEMSEQRRYRQLFKKPKILQPKDLIDGEINLEVNKGAITVNDDLDVNVDITKLAGDNSSPLSAAIDLKGNGVVTLGKTVNAGLAQVGAGGVLKTDGSVGAQAKVGAGNVAITAQGL